MIIFFSREGLQALDLEITEQHLSKIVRAADKDGSGEIDFREVCGIFARPSAP
jgi:Ca2+-binding EF-hand superfamily protein